MKLILKIVLTIVLATALQMMMPWWAIAIAGFSVSAVIYTKGLNSFVAGFIAVFLLWTIKAYLIDLGNEQLLSTKIATLFNVPVVSLPLLTGAIGGLVAGFASLTGSTFSNILRPAKKNRNKYYF